MKRFVAIACMMALLAMTAGCMKHTYDAGAGAPRGTVVYDKWESHWLFGIIGETQIDLKDVCPSGNATIHDEVDFLTGLVGALVGIVYRPSKVTIRCDEKTTSELELDRDTVAAIVNDPNFLPYVEQVAPQLLSNARQAQAIANGGRNAEIFLAQMF